MGERWATCDPKNSLEFVKKEDFWRSGGGKTTAPVNRHATLGGRRNPASTTVEGA